MCIRDSHSKKFEGGRKHIVMPDSLTTLVAAEESIRGRKHFEPKYDIPKQYKAGLRIFSKKYEHVNTAVSEPWKKTVRVEPIPPNPRHRPEKSHISGPPTGVESIETKGLSTFPNLANALSSKESRLEKTMGIKKTILELETKRNGLSVNSLGDKPYKQPEYSHNFFKDGGLVAGSTHKQRSFSSRKEEKPGLETGLSTSKNQKSIPWALREKMDQEKEEEKNVADLNQWEQTILKEARPDWKDPDLYELPDAKGGDKKAQAGAVDPRGVQKKGGKK
eukprot:TRINITY_DN11652_c0_g1_i2.p1 TRINITY_DN11652_c0_g1~~TRINITY_DN11652_c0_g1_i2.p1  ORF type:complete len:297 (-),score=67.37 TRINITY_DN11652_c0_g1_i2:4-834(-)